MADSGRWWGEFETSLDRWNHWLIGPLSLWARASAGEWRLSWYSAADRLIDQQAIEIPAAGEPDSSYETTRYVLADAGSGLRLTPRLADRPVVVRPETPLVIPPGQDTVLYVGTTLWIRVESLGPADALLTDIPAFRPSDTWFGSNTRVGELCYASRTKARTRAELLSRIPHRAVTPVEVINNGADALPVSQLRIPVQALSLYEAAGRPWTDGIRFTRELDSTSAEFEIDTESRYVPQERATLAAPQEPIAAKSVMEVFSSLF